MSSSINNRRWDGIGLLALTKEAYLAKQANGDAVASRRSNKPDRKQTFTELLPGHVASVLPAGTAVYGGTKGMEENQTTKGLLLGVHGLLGAKDKEQGVAGQNFAGVVGTGLVTGAALGPGVAYAAQKIDEYRNKKSDWDMKLETPPLKNRMLKYTLKGGGIMGLAGGLRYGLGSYFTDGPTPKQ